MLIDFTVENYRSIKKPVTLSAVAQTRGASRASATRKYVKSDNEIAPPYEVEGRGFALLPVLGIFGPNASGKSNVIRALDDLIYYMAVGADQRERNYGGMFVPFRLDETSATKPTRFQLRVVIEQTIYTYKLEIDRTRILRELLEYTPPLPKQDRLLFDRAWDENEKKYVWKNGPSFAGPHTQLEANLQEQEPFLSLLIMKLEVQTIMPLSRWLERHYVFGNLSYERSGYLMASLLGYRALDQHSKVCEILQRFDTGLTGLDVKKVEPEIFPDELKFEVIARHEVGKNQFHWAFGEESAGTQRLFALAHQIFAVFNAGALMLKDELEASLHPQITRAIIKMFQDPKTNPKRAQLIFTSHDYMLLNRQFLRRDQIWFTSKRPDQSTELYALSEFKERNDRDFATSYIDGRYGAVPILPPEEFLLPPDPVTESVG